MYARVAVQVVRHSDPTRFCGLVGDHLRRDEARHNLHLGLLATLMDEPDKYPRFHLWSVEDEGRTVGMALRTEPHNVVISRPEVDGVVEALADALVAEGAEVPGILGGLPEADELAARWQAATGARVASRTDQAIHVLREIQPPPEPSGAPRPAAPGDLELLVAWHRAFHDEAVPRDHYDEEHSRRWIARRIADDPRNGYRLWDDGEPVCLVGYIQADSGTPRIGPVYTPPAHRRRGYGTALTAHASREQLDRGALYCLLYTDLANPTSNAIYAKIGYRRVCDSAMILFDPPGGG